MKLTNILMIFTAIALLLIAPKALSHGEAKAQFGGMAVAKYDYNFELVRNADSVTLYVTDHDEPADVSNWQGEITLLAAGKKSAVAMTVQAGQLLAPLQIADGGKVVVSLKDENGKAMALRFSF